MIDSKNSFHDLEEVLCSLQASLRAYSGEKSTSLDHGSTRKEKKYVSSTISQEIPTSDCNDELEIENILMEILLHQKLHTSKEYSLNGQIFKVYVLDDTEL